MGIGRDRRRAAHVRASVGNPGNDEVGAGSNTEGSDTRPRRAGRHHHQIDVVPSRIAFWSGSRVSWMFVP